MQTGGKQAAQAPGLKDFKSCMSLVFILFVQSIVCLSLRQRRYFSFVVIVV